VVPAHATHGYPTQMGVNVELWEHGPTPRKGRAPTTVVDTVIDEDDIFAGLLNKAFRSGRTPTLDRIDPYANVILSGTDVEKFVNELAVLSSHADSDAEKRQLQAIDGLARKCLQALSDHRLHFVGD
jgi:hypothetical protein